MRKLNEFTFSELLIILALIGFLVVSLVSGFFRSNEANAAEVVYPLQQALNEWNVQYSYSTSGTLIVFNKGKTTWKSADVACTELKALDPNLKTVILTLGKETEDSVQLVWDKDNITLTNLSGRSEANCT